MLQLSSTEWDIRYSVSEKNKKRRDLEFRFIDEGTTKWSESEIKSELRKARTMYNKLNKALKEEKDWLHSSTLYLLWQSLKDWQRTIERLKLCQAYAPLSVEDRKALFD